MCGVAGAFAYRDGAPPVSEEELLRVREHMYRRGPDGAGLWIAADRRAGLAHRRLAIIDLSPAAAQPMASATGRYQIVFNGEIYNYLELKRELQAAGVVFRTQSDTEVLLELFARDGEAMLPRLRGMFAVAIWDTQEQSLFLARDSFGIKPLYFADDGQTLRFASQVKALVAGGAVATDLDHEGELGYWIWGHVPEPLTIYKSIRALEAGTWLRIERGGRRQTGVFESVSNLLSAPAAAERTESLHDALLDSVRHHLIADVPIGVFLSGGIDSSALASLAAESGYRLKTVTVGVEEYRGTVGDETAVADEVARKLGAEHHTYWVNRSEFEETFESFVEAMDQPTIDGLNTWLVSRAAAKIGLKVVISGVGGDEFFGGYPSFKHVPWMRRVARPFTMAPGLGVSARHLLAPIFRRFTNEKFAGILEYGGTWEGAYMLRRALRMPWQLEGRSAPVFSDPAGLPNARATVSSMEASRYMRNQLLRDSDWASMAQSIELRVPLVDAELTRHIGRQHARGHSYGKLDLAHAANGSLPRSVTHHPKRGFMVPLREWLLAREPWRTSRGLVSWSQFIYRNFTGVDS